MCNDNNRITGMRIRGRSVLTNMLRYFRYVHEALDTDTKTAIRAFYTDFFKAFDKVPHRVLFKNFAIFEPSLTSCFFKTSTTNKAEFCV